VTFRRIVRLSSLSELKTGLRAEFYSDGADIDLYIQNGNDADDLRNLIQSDGSGRVAVTFSRVPVVTGTCEVIKGTK
jgi:hypothetical protein